MTTSVVIPNRNYAEFLSKAIESCLAQSVLPCEIIVVDDGSTDDSLKVVAGHPQVRLLRYERKHLEKFQMGCPKNSAIRSAQGDYIICLDSDDYLEPSYIKRCLELMRPDVGIVATGMQCFGTSTRIWTPFPVITLKDIVADNCLHTSAMFRRQAWQQVGGFSEEHTFEDWDLWIRIMAQGWKTAVIQELLFNHQVHPISLTQKMAPAEMQKLQQEIRIKYAYLPALDIQGWMYEPELRWLYEMAKGVQSIVEVGSWKGRSTYALCAGCPGTVTAVDHFRGNPGDPNTQVHGDEVFLEFLNNTAQFKNLKVIRGDSVSAVERIPDHSVDVVFIDGDHTEEGAGADARVWLPKAKKLICGHDYSADWPGVQAAVKKEIGEVENPVGSIWSKTLFAEEVGRLLPNNRGLRIHGRDGAGRAGDEAIATEQFQMDIYQLNLLEKTLPPVETILDVGGHIGCFGLNAKSRWPTAHLIAYEPKRDSAELYRRNLVENGFSGDVIIAAISYEPDKTMLSDNPAWTGGGIMVNAETQKALPGHYQVSEQEVRVVDLEQALQESAMDTVDLLKLDCEGAEMGMLRHMTNEAAHKIGFIVGEYHCQTGDYVFHGGEDRVNGYKGFAELVQWKFPWFEMMPLGRPSDNIGNFAAGPPQLIAKLKSALGVDSILPVVTPLGNSVTLTLNDGARVSITGRAEADYHIRFDDADSGVNVYATVIHHKYSPGNYDWSAPLPKHFIRWHVTVREKARGGTPESSWSTDNLVLDYELNLSGKSVLISLTSKSLGDTLCWVPYALEFQKKHNCQVTVETFRRPLLEGAYPELKFCDAGTFVGKAYASYKIGCFDNQHNRNRQNWRMRPLQQVASDILGLPFQEIRPHINVKKSDRPIPEKYVCVSEFSTKLAKHWNNPSGWQAVADHLAARGLKVISVGEVWPRVGPEPSRTQIKGVVSRNGLSVEETIPIIQNAEFFIGVGAGHSWVAWALDVPVVLISGFSNPVTEMKDCIRIHNPNVCCDCYNDPSFQFDRHAWNWCPRGRNFECTRAISPETVVRAIAPLLKGRFGLGNQKVTAEIAEHPVTEEIGVVGYSGFTMPGHRQPEEKRVLNQVYGPGTWEAEEKTVLEGSTGSYDGSGDGEGASGLVGPDKGYAYVESETQKAWGTERIVKWDIYPHVLMLLPHCSTGGMPGYTLACVRELKTMGCEVGVVQYHDTAPTFNVQRNQLRELCAPNYITLGKDKLSDLQSAIKGFGPNIIHVQECPERWWPVPDVTFWQWLYRQDRSYRIVETCHSYNYDLRSKKYISDGYVHVSQFHDDQIKGVVAEYQVPAWKVRLGRDDRLKAFGLDSAVPHVLNVGLFTPGKNQGEIFEAARLLPGVQFHFVGNQAVNFANYWKPLMEDKPDNCIVWKERHDVEVFYRAMDLFLFSSTAELMPLAPIEALAYGMPTLMRRLPVYGTRFDGQVHYIRTDADHREIADQVASWLLPMGKSLMEAYKKK